MVRQCPVNVIKGSKTLSCTLALLATLLCLTGCEYVEGLYALRALPPAVMPEAVVYAQNGTYGFGPGGNETGLNVIRIADAGADLVAQGGIPWLDAQPSSRIRPEWATTPVPRNEFWMGRKGHAMGAFPAPTVVAVLNQYGFFDVPKDHQTALDAALNAPGSFYAFGPGGLVAVIVPKTRRAYVFYAG